MSDYLQTTTTELREIPAFHCLSDQQIQNLAAAVVRRDYVPGQIIFMEGDQSNALWFVFQGHVRIIKQSLNGRVQGLCMMNSRKCFGSCPLFDMAQNPATAQAVDNVTLFVMPKNALYQLKERDSGLVKVLLHIYSQRLEHLAHVSEVLGVWTVADRINDCLLTYANSAQPPAVELTHERLAALSGTIREVVTRHLAALEKQGIVQNEMGRIIILNADELLPPCAYESQKAFV